MQDPISDMLTRVRNAQLIGHKQVEMPSSKLKVAVAKVLQEEGYIENLHVQQAERNKPTLTLMLKYYQNKPVIAEIKRVSKPSLRVYRRANELPKVMDGLGVAIISTSKGVVSDRTARAMNMGGEVLCYVS
jgi:small subunit ribosomal protein S8